MKKQKQLEFYSGDYTTELPLQYADAGIFAGFPSPAQDYMDRSLDFNREIIRHPAATFYAKVVGQSMEGAGIDTGDIVVVDRALEPRDGDIVVACLNGDFTLKYIDLSHKERGIICLRPDNEEFEPIVMHEGDELVVWGVVSSVIKRFR
ncbi:MAG: translesion error-prone DNA polymerase V autoproteolytic subunit [Muribaculaceae bacterium]|nr:translesion error-prone DNA polymerase V autoproteolytic subunit [Muribaculaceae bacterium]